MMRERNIEEIIMEGVHAKGISVRLGRTLIGQGPGKRKENWKEKG